MTPQQIAEIIEKLITESDESFSESVHRYQQNIFRLVERLIYSNDPKYQLSLTSSGLIKPTASNIKILERIKREVQNNILPNTFINAVEDYTKVFDTIQEANIEFYREQFSQFNPSNTFDNIKKSARELAVTTMTDTAVKEAMIKPINSILDSATAAGGQSRADLITALNTAITNNPQRLGGYARYTNRIVTDSLNQFSRSYSEAITGFVKPQDRFYYYSSGTVRDTREFCSERAGKYFHYKEVESWAKQDWKGKIPATNKGNIFVLLGGYNCMHQLILVSQSVVPGSALRRMRETGLIG